MFRWRFVWDVSNTFLPLIQNLVKNFWCIVCILENIVLSTLLFVTFITSGHPENESIVLKISEVCRIQVSSNLQYFYYGPWVNFGLLILLLFQYIFDIFKHNILLHSNILEITLSFIFMLLLCFNLHHHVASLISFHWVYVGTITSLLHNITFCLLVFVSFLCRASWSLNTCSILFSRLVAYWLTRGFALFLFWVDLWAGRKFPTILVFRLLQFWDFLLFYYQSLVWIKHL